MTEKLRTAIIGAGPGGLIAAVILNKAGWDVTVFEADASELARPQGGSLDLHADSGQVALERAGLLEPFREMARHEDQETRSVDWQTGASLPGGPSEDSELDRPEIDRGDLRNLLLRALPERCVEWNRALLSLERHADGRFLLSFRDGRSREADLVIGADGAWSAVRCYLTPANPIYTGVTFMEGWIETPTHQQAQLVGNGLLFAFGPAQVFVAQKNGRGRICVYAAIKESKEALSQQIKEVGANTVVESAFQNWASSLRDLISACGEFAPRSINHMPLGFAWPQQDLVTLIGDAAHLMPPLGVGVNLAMLDASDLASAIVTGINVKESFRSAELMIRERGAEMMSQIIPAFEAWFADSEHQLGTHESPSD